MDVKFSKPLSKWQLFSSCGECCQNVARKDMLLALFIAIDLVSAGSMVTAVFLCQVVD